MNSHHPTRQQPKGQTGFSFIETLIVLAVLSVVVVQQLRTSELTSVDRVATGMVEKFQRVQRASMRYYSMTDSWPDGIDLLVEKNLLTQEETTNSWGKPFEFKVEGQESQDLLISSDLTEVRYASRVAGRLPRASLSVPDAAIAVSEARGGSRVGEVSDAGTVAHALTTKVTSRIDPPGHEAAHEKLYRLDGTKTLAGNMDAGGYNIENIGSLELVGDVVLGDPCDQKYIGTTVTGMLVSCVGASVNNSENTEKKGKWRIPNELPVGAVYISLTEDDPSGLLGYGTWESFGAGQVMVGQTGTLPTNCQTLKDETGKEVDLSSLQLVECWPYILGGTNHENTTNTTENAALAIDQMPDHRHWAKVVTTKNKECYEFWKNDKHCLILSEQAQASQITATTQTRNSAQQRARSTNELLTPIEMAIKQYHALLAAAETEAEKLSIKINFLKKVTEFVDDIHRKPFRNLALDDELSEGHQHEINQPSIVVKMWKRTG